MLTLVDGIERWREYFRTSNVDIFEIIERGILVAASDCPKEFKLRRDRIAEVLFSSRLTQCIKCDGVELSAPKFDEGGRGIRIQFEASGGSNESKDHSTRDDQIDVDLNPLSNYSYGEAEILTDEIEEQTSALQEVFRIKEILMNFEDESDSVLIESLRRLQLMRLALDALKATEIGKTVNGLKRHREMQIRHLVRELIAEWKAIVDDYMETVRDIADPAGSEKATPESFNPSVVDDEEGLPSPPLDDCVIFSTETIDFSQFFDGMDDDGNPQNNGAFNKKQKSGRTPAFKPDVALMKESCKQEVVLTKEDSVLPLRKHESVPKLSTKPLSSAFGPDKPKKPTSEQRVNPTQKLQKKTDKPNIPRRPSMQSEKIRCTNEDAVQEKLEAAKRRLQERYQEAENAKRQRTIQIMELHDLPKQGLAKRNSHNKSGSSNRSRANGQR